MWIINSLSVFVILHDALKMLALVHTCFCTESSKSSKDSEFCIFINRCRFTEISHVDNFKIRFEIFISTF